jgi:hypothetical protein
MPRRASRLAGGDRHATNASVLRHLSGSIGEGLDLQINLRLMRADMTIGRIRQVRASRINQIHEIEIDISINR